MAKKSKAESNSPVLTFIGANHEIDEEINLIADGKPATGTVVAVRFTKDKVFYDLNIDGQLNRDIPQEAIETGD